jgi:hypothetical protein
MSGGSINAAHGSSGVVESYNSKRSFIGSGEYNSNSIIQTQSPFGNTSNTSDYTNNNNTTNKDAVQTVTLSDEDIDNVLNSGTKKSIAETLYPAAEYLPLLPALGSGSRYLDVILCVEHCYDCETHNTQSLRHDSSKYAKVANEILFNTIKALIESKFAIRLYAMRTKVNSLDKLGGMEVTIAVNITKPLLSGGRGSSLSTPTSKLREQRKHSSVDFSQPNYKSKLSSSAAPSSSSLLKPGQGGDVTSTGGEESGTQSPVPLVDSGLKWATHQLFSKIDSKR